MLGVVFDVQTGDWFGQRCFMPLLTALEQTSPIPPNTNYIVFKFL